MRRFLIIGLLVVGTLFAGLAGFLLSFDINQYKPAVVAAVSRATGREFAIAGEVAFKLALLPTLRLHGVTLGNAAWAGPGPMLTVAEGEAQINLRALLARRLEITRVRMAGVRLELARNTDGSSNWEFAAAGVVRPTTPALPALLLKSLELSDAVFAYHTGSAPPRELAIDHLRLNILVTGVAQQIDLRGRFAGQAFTAQGEMSPLGDLLGGRATRVKLAIDAGPLSLGVTGSIAEPLAGRGLDFALTVSAPSSSALAGLMGLELPQLAPLEIAARLQDADGAYLLSDLAGQLGPTSVSGELHVTLAGERPALAGKLALGQVDLRPYETTAPGRAKPARLFSTSPYTFDALREFDAELEISIAGLDTRKLRFTALAGPLRLSAGRLELPAVRGTVEGGELAATLTLDAVAPVARLSQTLRIEGMALARVLGEGPAQGGKATVDIALSGHGNSAAAFAGSASGHVRIDARDMQMTNGAVGFASTDLLMQAFTLLNPLATRDPRTRIECAVVNFPVQDGIMSASRGLGVRTDKLNILGGGTIDLKTERIDIGVNPKPRSGIGFNMAGVADFVRLGGTLSAPAPVTDVGGAASAGLKVGGAFATGGLSLLAEGLLDRAGSDVDVCAVARGEQSMPAQGAASAEQPSTLDKAATATTRTLKSTGGAIKGAFKSLFGR